VNLVIKMFVIFYLIGGCGKGVFLDDDGSQVNDFVSFAPLHEDYRPKNIELISDLDWPTKEQARDLSFAEGREINQHEDISHLQRYGSTRLDPNKFCIS